MSPSIPVYQVHKTSADWRSPLSYTSSQYSNILTQEQSKQNIAHLRNENCFRNNEMTLLFHRIKFKLRLLDLPQI